MALSAQAHGVLSAASVAASQTQTATIHNGGSNLTIAFPPKPRKQTPVSLSAAVGLPQGKPQTFRKGLLCVACRRNKMRVVLGCQHGYCQECYSRFFLLEKRKACPVCSIQKANSQRHMGVRTPTNIIHRMMSKRARPGKMAVKKMNFPGPAVGAFSPVATAPMATAPFPTASALQTRRKNEFNMALQTGIINIRNMTKTAFPIVSSPGSKGAQQSATSTSAKYVFKHASANSRFSSSTSAATVLSQQQSQRVRHVPSTTKHRPAPGHGAAKASNSASAVDLVAWMNSMSSSTSAPTPSSMPVHAAPTKKRRTRVNALVPDQNLPVLSREQVAAGRRGLPRTATLNKAGPQQQQLLQHEQKGALDAHEALSSPEPEKHPASAIILNINPHTYQPIYAQNKGAKGSPHQLPRASPPPAPTPKLRVQQRPAIPVAAHPSSSALLDARSRSRSVPSHLNEVEFSSSSMQTSGMKKSLSSKSIDAMFSAYPVDPPMGMGSSSREEDMPPIGELKPSGPPEDLLFPSPTLQGASHKTDPSFDFADRLHGLSRDSMMDEKEDPLHDYNHTFSMLDDDMLR